MDWGLTEDTVQQGSKGKAKAIDADGGADEQADLEFRPEDEDVRAEDTVLDDEDNREEFVRQADDEEANEDSGSVNSHKPAAVNPMRCGGPGKPRSPLPTWLCANYDDMCERLKREMSTNQSRRPSCYDVSPFCAGC